jgi:hypothetical protein
MPAGGQHKSTPHQANIDIDISQLLVVLDLELHKSEEKTVNALC